MLQNICLICQKRDYAKQVAAILSERLDMQWFDVLDMTMFDDKPRTFTEILNLRGEDGVRRHERSCLKYACGFSNTIIVCEGGSIEAEDAFQIMHKNAVVVYLHCPAKRVILHNEQLPYASPEEHAFFVKDKKVVDMRIALSKQNADIIVTCTQKPPVLSASLVVRKLKEYAQKL